MLLGGRSRDATVARVAALGGLAVVLANCWSGPGGKSADCTAVTPTCTCASHSASAQTSWSPNDSELVAAANAAGFVACGRVEGTRRSARMLIFS